MSYKFLRSNKIKKHFFKIILSCLISILLIYLCVRNLDFTQSVNIIKNANLKSVAFALVIYILSFVARSLRWEYILLPLKKIKPFRSFFFLVFGFFMNNVLPLRLGEFVRAKVAGEKLQISRSGVFATVVVERLVDVIIFIIIFFLIALFVDIPGWLKHTFILCTVIFGLIFVVLFFMSKKQEKFVSLISKFHLPLNFSNMVENLFVKFSNGLEFFQHTKLIIIVLLMSAVVWYIEAFSYKLFFGAFGVEISVMQALFFIVVTGVATMIPTAPGFVGAIEASGIVALGIFGIDQSTAFTTIASVHFGDIIMTYLIGIIGMIKEKISFSDLFKFATTEEKRENKQNGK